MARSSSEPPRLLVLQLFIVKNFEALEADMARYYGLDLAQACWGRHRVSLRRLKSLISHLPPESALARSLSGKGEWGTTQELLAGVLEALGATIGLLHRAHFKAPHPEPIKVPRPYESQLPETREYTTDELMEQFPEFARNN